MGDTASRAVAPVEGVPSDAVRSSNGDFDESAESEVLQRLREDVHDIVTNDTDRLNIEMLRDLESRYEVPKHAPDVFADFLNHQPIHPADFNLLVAALYRTDNLALLSKHRIVHPAYRTYQDYYRNATSPAGVLPMRTGISDLERSWTFLGRNIDFPIGVGASGITMNSSWVQHWFRCGYSVVTYKTVCSEARQPYAGPNWSFVSDLTYDDIKDPNSIIKADSTLVPATPTLSAISSINSFGVPSSTSQDWSDDLKAACAAAGDGQVLICSILGSGNSPGEVVDDFVEIALHANRSDAEFIELNLSLPNPTDEDELPPLCSNIPLSVDIVTAVRQALPDSVALGVKLPYLTKDELWSFLDACVDYLDFVVGINSIQRIVEGAMGEFFPGRKRAGIAGAAILPLAEEFVQNLATYRVLLSSNFAIVATGGVTDPDSFMRLYSAGADVVQSVTGVFANSLLASDCIKEFGNHLPYRPLIRSVQAREHLSETALEMTPADTAVPLWRYVSALDVPVDSILEVLNQLVSKNKLIKQIDNNIQKYIRAESK
ncbi:hypothetical protein [Mycobacteroides abscessus]|uniref:hypothetical protein n=1 Tax=Mycobacteroides abscessus TaxID=36809 RepID=UPI000C262565|nr:hypothetical protein [Mycobacteroides abscessus]